MAVGPVVEASPIAVHRCPTEYFGQNMIPKIPRSRSAFLTGRRFVYPFQLVVPNGHATVAYRVKVGRVRVPSRLCLLAIASSVGFTGGSFLPVYSTSPDVTDGDFTQMSNDLPLVEGLTAPHLVASMVPAAAIFIPWYMSLGFILPQGHDWLGIRGYNPGGTSVTLYGWFEVEEIAP
jgi:hypothetical protein